MLLNLNKFIIIFVIITVLATILATTTTGSLLSEESNSKKIEFKWIDYLDVLSETMYDLRVNVELEPNIKYVMLECLVIDELLPSYALSLADLDDDIFINFILGNVEIEYVDIATRGCCSYANLEYHVTNRFGKYNSNGWCIRHCKWTQIRCRVCYNIYQSAVHAIEDNGCGKHHSNPKYQICARGAYYVNGIYCSSCN